MSGGCLRWRSIEHPAAAVAATWSRNSLGAAQVQDGRPHRSIHFGRGQHRFDRHCIAGWRHRRGVGGVHIDDDVGCCSRGRVAKRLSEHGWYGDVSTRACTAKPPAARLTGPALGGTLYCSCHCRAASAAQRHGQRPAAADSQLVAALAGPRAGGERARAVESRRVGSRTPQARAPRRPAAASAAATTSQRACARGSGGEGCWHAFVQGVQAAPATSGVGGGDARRRRRQRRRRHWR